MSLSSGAAQCERWASLLSPRLAASAEAGPAFLPSLSLSLHHVCGAAIEEARGVSANRAKALSCAAEREWETSAQLASCADGLLAALACGDEATTQWDMVALALLPQQCPPPLPASPYVCIPALPPLAPAHALRQGVHPPACVVDGPGMEGYLHGGFFDVARTHNAIRVTAIDDVGQAVACVDAGDVCVSVAGGCVCGVRAGGLGVVEAVYVIPPSIKRPLPLTVSVFGQPLTSQPWILYVRVHWFVCLLVMCMCLCVSVSLSVCVRVCPSPLR